MPVLDHPVHPSVRVGSDHRYGCHNKPRPAEGSGYRAPDRFIFKNGDFAPATTFVPHRMSTTCRYDMSLTDPSCTGCEHRGQGENYDRSVRGACEPKKTEPEHKHEIMPMFGRDTEGRN